MRKVNSTGVLSRIFAVVIALLPLLFIWMMLSMAGRSLVDVVNTVGFYIVLVVWFFLISFHLYYNFFDYDVYVKGDEIVLKRYLFTAKIERKENIKVEANGLISIFLFGFLLKSNGRSYLFKKTPKNLKERLNPKLALERIKTELDRDQTLG